MARTMIILLSELLWWCQNIVSTVSMENVELDIPVLMRTVVSAKSVEPEVLSNNQ